MVFVHGTGATVHERGRGRALTALLSRESAAAPPGASEHHHRALQRQRQHAAQPGRPSLVMCARPAAHQAHRGTKEAPRKLPGSSARLPTAGRGAGRWSTHRQFTPTPVKGNVRTRRSRVDRHPRARVYLQVQPHIRDTGVYKLNPPVTYSFRVALAAWSDSIRCRRPHRMCALEGSTKGVRREVSSASI